jgi:hypothetical protein
VGGVLGCGFSEDEVLGTEAECPAFLEQCSEPFPSDPLTVSEQARVAARVGKARPCSAKSPTTARPSPDP